MLVLELLLSVGTKGSINFTVDNCVIVQVVWLKVDEMQQTILSKGSTVIQEDQAI